MRIHGSSTRRLGRRRGGAVLATLLAFALFAAACGDDDGAAPDSGPSPETVDDPSEPTAATVPASFSAATSAGQVTVTGAEAGNELELRGPGEVQHGVVDELGNLLFLNVEPGSGWQVLDLAAEPTASSEPLGVSSLDDHPDPAFTTRRRSVKASATSRCATARCSARPSVTRADRGRAVPDCRRVLGLRPGEPLRDRTGDQHLRPARLGDGRREHARVGLLNQPAESR